MIYFNITLEGILDSMLRNNSCLVHNFIGNNVLLISHTVSVDWFFCKIIGSGTASNKLKEIKGCRSHPLFCLFNSRGLPTYVLNQNKENV